MRLWIDGTIENLNVTYMWFSTPISSCLCFVPFFLTGEVVQRYNALEMGVNDFLEKLRIALANTQGVMENLDMLEKWLDEAEKEQHKLEKGTVTPARREPILDQIENNKVSLRGSGRDDEGVCIIGDYGGDGEFVGDGNNDCWRRKR